ncbi:hypothetical protein ACFYW8_42920 [Streptomyces sp. NPDC002742]|uniref:hypothetical protein n=1 Tax=Streptomyces sp. NPDC002742 TaxID=3364663 RepID=UPI003689BB72
MTCPLIANLDTVRLTRLDSCGRPVCGADNGIMFDCAASLEKVETKESSRRGLLTLIPSSGIPEMIRTEQDTTIPGRAMIARAESLVGRWVLVYRTNEPKAGTKFDNVRMVVRLVDLGEGPLPNGVARRLLIGDAGGDQARAKMAWHEARLPLQGQIPVADLDPVRRKVRGEHG